MAQRWVAWDTGPFTPHYRGRDTREAGSVQNTKGEAPMSEGSGRQEMERRLIEKSLEDEAFRQRLIEDPKAAVEQELGKRLPEEVRVVALEETQDTSGTSCFPAPRWLVVKAKNFRIKSSSRWLAA